MKIALYVPSWPPGSAPNGIVTYASQIVPALRRLGHEVFIITPWNREGDSSPYTIDLKRFAPKGTIWYRTTRRLMPEQTGYGAAASSIATAVRELIARYDVDVLEIEESFGWSFEISRAKLLPVVVRLHGPWFLNGRFDYLGDRTAQRRQQQERKGIEHADFVSAPSAEVLRSVKFECDLALPSSRVIANPLEVFGEEEIWSTKTCVKDSLLYVGRFDRRKGGDLILRLFAALVAKYPKLTLTFVGPDRGVHNARGETVMFEQFVRDIIPGPFRPRIKFCGTLNNSDVTALRSKHFATIVASQYEIAPYSILEAMSMGCPLLSTAVGGIPEMIKDGRNGLLVPSQDVDAMAAACQRLLDDPALAARLGRQAWLDCRELYAPEIVAERTVAAYREAIAAFQSRMRPKLLELPASSTP